MELPRLTDRPALSHLRLATGELHRRLEDRFDAVTALGDPDRRPQIVARYQRLYSGAFRTLMPWLSCIAGLEMARRAGMRWPDGLVVKEAGSPFPEPADTHEALGLLYVIEGSTLGGRLILKALARKGIIDPSLSFLDPYGNDSARMWRAVLTVIEHEGQKGPAELESICRGGVRGFTHAENTLCGDAHELSVA
jgi:heme oxygenase